MTPLTPVYKMHVQCFTRRGNRILSNILQPPLADDVSFHAAWFAMLHYIRPVHPWFPNPDHPDVSESFPVKWIHFIITQYGDGADTRPSIYSYPICDWGELHDYGRDSP